MATKTATQAQFSAYENMFRHFNKVLFSNQLPPCMLNFSRKNKTYGFFAPKRWEDSGSERVHEISLNPSHLKGRDPIAVVSTLVHEMCHLWQQEFGKPSRTGYHNQEWSSKMVNVGLQPSSTGQEGGATVGQKMTHYVIKGGVFEKAFKEMPKDYWLPLSSEDPLKAPKATNRNKVKYSCPGCQGNVWGKSGLSIVCDDCEERFDEIA